MSNLTPQALRRSFEDDFYGSTIQKLVAQGRVSTIDSILVTAGGTRDKETWEHCGFKNVTISNLDDRMVGNEFAPFKWSFQDAEKLTFDDNSVDFVCIHNGLHHCGCPQAAVLEMLRVSRKGILLFEPYDNLVTRLGMRFGVSQKFETAAVFYSGFTHGGLRNGPVANYVYRFTKWELEKTISTAYPEGPVELQFIHALRVPWEQLKGRRNKIPYFLTCVALPFLILANRLIPEQGNCFAAYIAKRSDEAPLWPWVMRSTSGSCEANRDWLSKKYQKLQ
jgi:SAM-dependent methyltransferase